ncbi:hypothetical protein PVL29_011030 [Vitis rotundifolia]|uniref:Uncharacterized protein n=1 Tax=Vitis rotundifolia TaxID=103349 RepID=A0AA39DSL2_VITRO|nr:hypothetical protein PVL29_011030 [Vitis rotundifolia]
MRDLVGTWQENCFLMIIVVSMGNRYDIHFFHLFFFTLNMNYFSLIKVSHSLFFFFLVAYFLATCHLSFFLRYLICDLGFFCSIYTLTVSLNKMNHGMQGW